MLSEYRSIIGCLALLSILVGIATPIIGSMQHGFAKLGAIDFYVQLDKWGAIDYSKLKSSPGFEYQGDSWIVPLRLVRGFGSLLHTLFAVAMVFELNGVVLVLCWWKCPRLRPNEASSMAGVEKDEASKKEA